MPMLKKTRVESDNIFRTSLLMMQQEVVGWLMPWFGWPGDVAWVNNALPI